MNEIEQKVKEFRKKEGIRGVPTFEQLKAYILKSGFHLNTYSESHDLIEKMKREKGIRDVPAFTAKIDDTYRVFYNEKLNKPDLIFALCHECGHISLNHLFNRRGAYDTSIHKEQEAFQFAVLLVNYPLQRKKKLIHLLSGTVAGLFLCSLSVLAAAVLPDKQTPPITDTYYDETSVRSAVQNSAYSPADVSFTSDYVAVTKWGTKYHLPTCPQIQGSKTVANLTVAEAETAGYTPCKICIR